MTRLTEQFSSDRMVREYVEQAYLPAAQAFLQALGGRRQMARKLEAWSALLDEQWHGVRFGRVFIHEAEQQWQFEIEAYLGEVCADFVQVQLYAEAAGVHPTVCVTLQPSGPIHGAVNAFLYRGSVPDGRPASTTRRESYPAIPWLSCRWKPRTSPGEVDEASPQVHIPQQNKVHARYADDNIFSCGVLLTADAAGFGHAVGNDGLGRAGRHPGVSKT